MGTNPQDEAPLGEEPAGEAWLQTQPEEFRPIITRWGKELFTIAFHSWTSMGALATQAALEQRMLQTLANASVQTRKLAGEVHPHLRTAHGVLRTAIESYGQMLLARLPGSPEEQIKAFLECRQDIERAASLAQQLRAKEAGPQIVLPNGNGRTD